jgi:hypothetical protein
VKKLELGLENHPDTDFRAIKHPPFIAELIAKVRERRI